MISNDAAARIAKQRGLSLQDAAALQSMAADEADAEKLAAEFTGTNQLGREDLAGMSHREINKAKAEGRLNKLMGGES